MTSDKSTPALMSLLVLKVASKLQGPEEYLKWRRIMQDYLKIPDLRTYVDGQPAELVRALETEVIAWRARYDTTFTTIRLTIDGNAYSDFGSITNVSEAWELVNEDFKPPGPASSMTTFK